MVELSPIKETTRHLRSLSDFGGEGLPPGAVTACVVKGLSLVCPQRYDLHSLSMHPSLFKGWDWVSIFAFPSLPTPTFYCSCASQGAGYEWKREDHLLLGNQHSPHPCCHGDDESWADGITSSC